MDLGTFTPPCEAAPQKPGAGPTPPGLPGGGPRPRGKGMVRGLPGSAGAPAGGTPLRGTGGPHAWDTSEAGAASCN